VIIGINYFQNKNLQLFDLGSFVWKHKTTPQDVIEAINDNEKITSFKNESLEYLESKTYTYDLNVLGLTKEEASNDAYIQAEKYSKEFSEYVNKYLDEEYFTTQKTSLSSPFVNIYSKLVNLNSLHNIEPIDYYQFETVLLPQVKENFLHSVSREELPNINQKFNILKKQAKTEILNKHLNSFELNKFLASSLNNEGLTKEKEMEFVTIEVMKMITNKFLVLNENPEIDFTSLLAPYSETGAEGYSNKNNKNILEQKVLNKLFLAKRDFLGNTEMLKPDDRAQANEEITIDKIKEQELLPLDKYIPATEGMPTFEENEIIPGYTLHARIISIDYATNSEVANVGFQLGVSRTFDESDSNINWIGSDEQNQTKEYLFHEYKLTSFAQKYNCAKNFLYPNELKLEYKNENFDAKAIVNRSTITDILHSAPTDANDHYLFNEQNPYLVNVDKLELPGIVKPHQLENNHTNEKIMLAITKANTNFNKVGSLQDLLNNQELVENSADAYRFQNLIPFVEAKWVLVDNVPGSEEYKIIKEYK
jgi:hypothetical protein